MIREIFEYILSFLKSRLLPLVLVFILLFVTILVRLFSLQIVNGDVYAQSVTDSQEKTMSVPATRGRKRGDFLCGDTVLIVECGQMCFMVFCNLYFLHLSVYFTHGYRTVHLFPLFRGNPHIGMPET